MTKHKIDMYCIVNTRTGKIRTNDLDFGIFSIGYTSEQGLTDDLTHKNGLKNNESIECFTVTYDK